VNVGTRRKNEVRPGDTVGRRSPKDDGLPQNKLLRGQTIRTSGRGRTEPRRGAQPPKQRGK
jgi:hypothetical protein